jgi:hypothetical protein
MSNVKVFKKGEFLFKEGEKIQNLLLIQQGAVSLCLARPKKNVDLFQIGSSQILGEQALKGASTHPLSAMATQETKVMEIPLELLKQQTEAAPQTIKVLIKSLVDRLVIASNEVKSSKLEKDTSPCPEDQVAKIFGSIYHTAHHKGEASDEKNKSKITMDWTAMKQYAQRVFAESPKRLEQACCILVKMKLAQFEMGKLPEDPEGPDVIVKIHFFDLAAVEAFFEFYQYYYFKGGKAEILKTDDTCVQILANLIALADGLPLDRHGVVSMDFSKTIERFKSDFSINLNNDHFARLEQKGIFAKRAPRTDGTVVLQFELKEFQTTQKIWRMLREVEKWNEKGFVDLNEDESKPKKKTDGPTCPQCGAGAVATAKFCTECGTKLAAA